ncbi:MAG: septum formation inhibitor Maf [Saprospiraceae bacterium]|nr:septum formation inhibitor Maf [Saprospiraceae bacterium]
MEKGNEDSFKLNQYWYQGKAEITTYELSQNRYKDVNPGEVVLIFVTEDFLTDKQVKNDLYQNPNSISILKSNKIKRFTTGIYDYSVMTSTFTPVERNKHPHTLKVTCSSQDWCGQSFQQVNLERDEYKSMLHSYFENEADRTNTHDLIVLEDELMNMIRMNPNLLPIGKFKMMPSMEYLRLKHKPFQSVNAEASNIPYDKGYNEQELMKYNVQMQSEKRTLEIVYESSAPYKIIEWTIEYPSAFDGQLRKTIARKKGEQYIPYWKNNGILDTLMRKELDLMY